MGASLSAQAQDVCALLNEVVVAGNEEPPFGSVMHLAAPNAECSVEPRSWSCSWDNPALAEAHEDAVFELEYAEEDHEEAEEESDDAFDEYMDSDIGSARNDRLAAKHDRLEAEEERLYAEVKRLEDEIDKLRNEIDSEARNLVSSVKQCLHERKIDGSWGKFDGGEVEHSRGNVWRKWRNVCSGSGICMSFFTSIAYDDAKVSISIDRSGEKK